MQLKGTAEELEIDWYHPTPLVLIVEHFEPSPFQSEDTYGQSFVQRLECD